MPSSSNAFIGDPGGLVYAVILKCLYWDTGGLVYVVILKCLYWGSGCFGLCRHPKCLYGDTGGLVYVVILNACMGIQVVWFMPSSSNACIGDPGVALAFTHLFNSQSEHLDSCLKALQE
ncbi:hypothetical protein [Shewanella sp.]|uniref:hypothetical protein n=1 Tax=Shewanella sp. TaxID=50422 RepID=UPI0040483977